MAKGIGIVGLCLLALTSVQAAKADTATPEEIARAQAVISRQLIDPASAQFQITTIQHLGAAVVFCGQVNSKNRLGGYTGFHPFVLFGDDLTIYDGRPGTGATFAELQQMMCGK